MNVYEAITAAQGIWTKQSENCIILHACHGPKAGFLVMGLAVLELKSFFLPFFLKKEMGTFYDKWVCQSLPISCFFLLCNIIER